MNPEVIPALGLEAPARPAASARALDGPCAVLSWALPLGIALWSLSGDAGFRDDLGIVRDLGLSRVGTEGVVSTLLTQAMALLPLGGRALRASLVGLLALGFASRCFFGLVRSALDRRGAAANSPVLALLASSLWALGPALQSEAARVGGALPAVALVLCGLTLGRLAFEGAEAAALAGAGLVLGATLAESHAAGACLALGLAGLARAEPSHAWRQGAWRLLGAGAAMALLLGSLRWWPPVSALVLPSPGAELLVAPSSAEPHALGASVLIGQAVALVAQEVGGAALALALAGAVVAARLAPLRGTFGWALPLALCAGAPAALGVSAVASPLFTLLASLGTIAWVPFALQAFVRWAWRSRLPLAQPCAVLALAFASTLVLSRIDAACLERPPQRGAAAWADEALGRLPPGSVILVQSPALAFRLLASRTLHDTRPDVVVVPPKLLAESSLVGDLQRTAPSVAPLLRQLWVNGMADEYSLSSLADERPVFVELDATSDAPELLEHLRPAGLWLSYSGSALGASERSAGVPSSRAALRRVLASAGAADAAGVDMADVPREAGASGASGVVRPAAGGELDGETRRALGDAVAGQALALAALAEHEPAGRLLRAARGVDPHNRLAARLAASLTEPTRGRVAAFELLE